MPDVLNDEQMADIKEWLGSRSHAWHWSHVARLVETVEQVRRERDAAHTVIRRMDGDWRPLLAEGPPTWRQFFYASTSPTLRGDHRDEPMTPAEVDAIRAARATLSSPAPDTGEETG